MSEQRKIAAEALEHKLLLENLVQNVEVGILVQGPGAEIILNNSAALEMLGFTQDQLLGKTSFDKDWKVTRKDGTDFPGEEHPVPTAIRTLQPVKDVHMCVYRPSQQNWIWLLVDAIPVFTEEKNLQYVICSFKDISELVKKEQELQKSHDTLNKLSNQLPGAIFQLKLSADTECDFQYCSSGIMDLIGCSQDDLLNNFDHFFSLIAPDDQLDFMNSIKAAGASSLPFLFEFKMNLKGKGSRWFSINSRPEKLEEGISLFYGFLSDITERKNAENEIKKTNERFDYATQATSDGIYEWDIIEDIAYWSDGFRTIFGYEHENQTGDFSVWQKRLDEHCREAVLASLGRAIKGSANRWCEEYKIRKGSGDYIDVVDTALIIRDGNGKALRLVGALKDISLQKQRDQQLRLFESVIKNANDVIVISEAVPINGNSSEVIYVNDAFVKQTGYSKDEIVGSTTKILQGEETAEETKKMIATSLINGKPVQTDIVNYKKSGEKFWNRLFISPVADQAGVFTHWVSIQIDVTKEKEDERISARLLEEKIALKAIEKSERRYSQLVDSIHEILFTTDVAGNWSFLNKAWERVMEYTVEECLNIPFFSYLHKDDVEKNAALFTPLITRQKTYCQHNIRYVTKSGKIKWMEVYAVLIINEHDEITGTSGTLRDITIEKKNEHYYRLLSQNIKELICVHNTDLTFLYLSPSIKEILGYEVDDMIDRSLLDIVHPDDLNMIHNLIADHEKMNSETYTREFIARYLRKDGRYTWMETIGSMFFDEYSYEKKIVSSSKVIDKRIESERNIQQALEKEKMLNELKSRFISTASHEFKTPLTVIKSTVELLSVFIAMGKPGINFEDSLTVINNEVDDLSQLLNDILILERLDYKKVKFEASSVDIIEWLQALLEKFIYSQKDNRVAELLYKFDKRNINVDLKLMHKVITNLLSNAFKYSEGKANPIVEVVFLEDKVIISVQDFGIGIPEADIEQLFNSFYRARNVGNIDGTGLGLSIVKNYVEMHSGYLEVHTKEHEGARFTIHLPQ